MGYIISSVWYLNGIMPDNYQIPPLEKRVIKYCKMADTSNYLETLGIHEGLLQEPLFEVFELGFCPSNGNHPDRITFPVRTPDGKLLGIEGLRTDGVEYQKYFQLARFPRNKTLYGLYQSLARFYNGVFIVAEGLLDVLKGHSFLQGNVVATMGGHLSAEQAALLLRFAREVWVVGSDGFRASVTTLLGGRIPLYGVPLPEGVTGLVGLEDDEEWFECTENRMLISKS